MDRVNARLLMIDGKQLTVRVNVPPPATFTLARFPECNRRFTLAGFDGIAAVYLESERRTAVKAVARERRRRDAARLLP